MTTKVPIHYSKIERLSQAKIREESDPVEVLCICCAEIMPEAHAKKLYWEKEKGEFGQKPKRRLVKLRFAVPPAQPAR